MKVTTAQLKAAICQHLEQEFIPKATSTLEKGVMYGAIYLVHSDGEAMLNDFAKNNFVQKSSFSYEDGTINAAKLYDMSKFIIGKVGSITIQPNIPLIGNSVRGIVLDDGDVEKIMNILKALAGV